MAAGVRRRHLPRRRRGDASVRRQALPVACRPPADHRRRQRRRRRLRPRQAHLRADGAGGLHGGLERQPRPHVPGAAPGRRGVRRASGPPRAGGAHQVPRVRADADAGVQHLVRLLLPHFRRPRMGRRGPSRPCGHPRRVCLIGRSARIHAPHRRVPPRRLRTESKGGRQPRRAHGAVRSADDAAQRPAQLHPVRRADAPRRRRAAPAAIRHDQRVGAGEAFGGARECCAGHGARGSRRGSGERGGGGV
mmetsp:Transcript_29709/g.74296  ORF Transcript_29709/g.74296 Transcript_29709/m.74296 type:complete len:249 (-) Transcript_29709:618-1364(-)